jgi:hypothetical protein
LEQNNQEETVLPVDTGTDSNKLDLKAQSQEKVGELRVWSIRRGPN